MSSHIYFLLDASGSMAPKINLVVDSVNEFLEDQKQIGNCKVNMYTFSRQLTILYEDRDIHSVDVMKASDFKPYGTTALWDSMGQILEKIPTPKSKDSQDKKNILIIVTDGEENASKDWNPFLLREEIERLENQLEIVYIGSNQDAVLNGKFIGSKRDSSLDYSDEKLPEAIRATSNAVRRYRNNTTPHVMYTPLERETTK